LFPTLNVGHEQKRGQKTTIGQYLTPIRPELASRRLQLGIRFC
jgi:hypothetical protein